MLWNEQLRVFVAQHLSDNLDRLLLSAHRYPGIDMPYAVDQIEARRRLRTKLPEWYALDDIVMGGRIPAEQCSSDELVIAADTIVWNNGRILGKPHSREEAFNMLRTLSGKTHEVITAVTIRDGKGRRESFSDVTKVSFAELSDDEIDFYIDSCAPFDKAGAYGIQEWIGLVGITRIEGSFYTIMGLPTHLLHSLLISLQ